jgi:TRAP-type C4-dicarboxylate transport system permease small subunit
MVVGLIFASRDFEGYSWTSSVSLTLLLWMAFFGASMATYARRHLAIDAIRKAIPTSALRFFNAASYMVTAVATAALLYLSYLYFLSRIGDVTEPGKVPDSWKVLSIPVALAVVTIRFLFYSIGEFILGMLGYEPEEQATIEEVA